MWKILTAASTALVLIGTPALAQLDAFDLDGDAFIDETEFGSAFDDADVFDDLDMDDDDLLSEVEFDTGFGENYDEEMFGAYGDWDADESGFLSEDEFGAGIYDSYDIDDDDMWDEEEFGVYEEDDWF